MRKFLFILGSARNDGNTEHLARSAARSLSPSTKQTWIHLLEHRLPLFEDIRHHESRKYSIASASEKLLLDATLDATDIVIASPVYWYSISAATKLYLDHWSGWLRTPGLGFEETLAGRTLWGVTVLADEQPSVADPLVGTLRNSAAYLGMRFGGVLLGNGSKPGDVLNDTEALARAKTFFAQDTPLARFPYETR